QAFIWDRVHGMQDLGLGYISLAAGINDNGEVVGTYSLTGDNHAYIWTSAGGVVDLGTLGGESSFAFSINSEGDVVGLADSTYPDSGPFYWSPAGGMIGLPSFLPGGYALGVNDSSQVTGWLNTADTPVGFIWSTSSPMRPLGILPGGSFSQGRAINN